MVATRQQTPRRRQSSPPRPSRLGWLALIAVLGITPLLPAQLRLNTTSRGPHYVEEGVEIRLEADLDGDLTCTPPTVEEGRLQLLDAGRLAGGSITIMNGRRTIRENPHYWVYRFSADKPGRYDIPGFTVAHNGNTYKSRATAITLREVPQRNVLRVAVELPERVYVGQQVPVRLEWWYSEPLENILGSSGANDLTQRTIWVRCSLFDDESTFIFEDLPLSRSDVRVPLETHGGRIAVKGELQRRTIDGNSYVGFVAIRNMTPLRAGRYEVTSSTTVEYTTRWTRSFIRRPVDAIRVGNKGETTTLEVIEPPAQNRPKSYSGAIGRGFSMKVTTDRSVVRVRDTLTLTLTIRGDGNLDLVGAPALSEFLDPQLFSVQVGRIGGILDEESSSKTFTCKARVLSDRVNEIPPIPFSWFDIEKGSYDTVTSDPIALAVRGAQMVGPEAVVGTHAENSTTKDTHSSANIVDAPGRGLREFALGDADLSLVKDPQRVLVDQRRTAGGRGLLVALYGTPLLMLLLAIWGRRRSAIDPQLLAQRKTLKRALSKVESTKNLDQRQGCGAIAGALREMISVKPQARNGEVDALLAECDAVLYAPTTQAPPLAREFHDRAVSVARKFVEARP